MTDPTLADLQDWAAELGTIVGQASQVHDEQAQAISNLIAAVPLATTTTPVPEYMQQFSDVQSTATLLVSNTQALLSKIRAALQAMTVVTPPLADTSSGSSGKVVIIKIPKATAATSMIAVPSAPTPPTTLTPSTTITTPAAGSTQPAVNTSAAPVTFTAPATAAISTGTGILGFILGQAMKGILK